MCFQTKQKQNQSSTQTTQNNLWDDPNLQTFLQGYNQQYSGPNISQVSAPANSWMTGAADAQSGVMSGLAPGFGAATALATTGLQPGNIQQWMNPFESSVIQNLQDDFASENARELSNIRGRAAMQGALGNSNTAVAERLATDSARDRLDSQITNARLQGWGQAANLNTQDAQTRLAGASQIGALSGIASGANQTLGTLGQNIWQTNLANQMLPYQLYNQGIQGYTGLGGLAGSTSTGQSTGTTTATPSIGSTILGGLGTVMSGMPSGWFNPGGWFGGGAKTFRDGGAIKRDMGGAVMTPFRSGGSTFADKVKDAHRAVEEMRRGGGRVEKKEGYADGGAPYTGFAPRLFDPYLSQRRADAFSAVAPPVTPSSIFVPSVGIDYSGSGRISGLSPAFGAPPMRPYVADASEYTAARFPDATEFTDAPEPRIESFRPFGDGPTMTEFERPGTVDITSQYTAGPSLEGAEQPATVTRGGVPGPAVADFVTTARADPAKPVYARDAGEAPIGAERTGARGPGGWFGEGIWAGERATPMQRFGMALTQVGGRDAPWAGFGASMMGQMQQSNQERQAELAARRLDHEMAHQRNVLAENIRANRAREEQGNWHLRPDGTMINRRTAEIAGSGIPSEFERRRAEAAAAGLREGSPGYQQFILTGRMGSTELSPAQASRLHAAREAERTAEGTLRDLRRAIEINGRTYSGWGAEGRADIVQNIPLMGGTQAARETQELARIMTGQMLGRLRSIFGGNPTEGERRILAEVEGSANLSPGVREDILKRAQELVQASLDSNRQTIAEIEGRTFGRPRTGAPTAERDTSAPNPNAIPERPASIPAGAQWNPARRQWRDSAGKLYDAEGKPVNG